MAHRRAVSLLEVMWAIAVVVIGLLGVLALFPVAFYQAERGAITDRAARLGRNAFQMFDIYGMRDPAGWRYADGRRLQPWQAVGSDTVNEFAPIDWTQGSYVNPQFPHFTGPAPDYRPQDYVPESFCLDPRGVTFSNGVKQVFPYIAPADPTRPQAMMSRITLPQQQVGNVPATVLWDRLFVSRDDLKYDRPTDGQKPAIQVYGGNPQANKPNSQRQFDGHLTWMATLTPEIDTLADSAGGYSNNLYLLSIVVMFQRDMTERGERLAIILPQGFHSAGLAGGDVSIYARFEAALEVKQGEWVMLGAKRNDGLSVFRWYKVVARDRKILKPGESDNSTQFFRRDLTLNGPDWNADPNLLQSFTEMTIVPGVVAVYEKTIRLESSTLWNQEL